MFWVVLSFHTMTKRWRFERVETNVVRSPRSSIDWEKQIQYTWDRYLICRSVFKNQWNWHPIFSSVLIWILMIKFCKSLI